MCAPVLVTKTILSGAMPTSPSFYLFAENKKKKNLWKLARQWKTKLCQRRSRNFVKRKRSKFAKHIRVAWWCNGRASDFRPRGPGRGVAA